MESRIDAQMWQIWREQKGLSVFPHRTRQWRRMIAKMEMEGNAAFQRLYGPHIRRLSRPVYLEPYEWHD